MLFAPRLHAFAWFGAASLAAGCSESSAPPEVVFTPGEDASAAGGDSGSSNIRPGDAAARPDTSGDAGGGDRGPGGNFRSYADACAHALHAFYDASTGLWNTTGWWNSANALTAVIDYSILTGSTAYHADIGTTFELNRSKNFLNNYYDDEGWWALAWIRAFDLGHDSTYLDMAKTIFKDMTGGWDATCSGGIWWTKDRTYKNAIANELFFEVAIRLHERTSGDSGAGSFIDWARREWGWFEQSGMINSMNLVNDGLAKTCKNNNGPTWTYNQGVLIGALVDLSTVTNDATLLSRANAIAQATMTTLVDEHGVLTEPCEAKASCGGDGTQFKGIFVRHLSELQAKTKDEAQRVFLTSNADWIWNAARNSKSQFGLTWRGPFDKADASRQSSACDALIAAIPFSEPVSNVALKKTATGDPMCASGQAAAQAIDGLLTTKWCSRGQNGTYSLDVDFGAPVQIGRLIVRHAGAGGESQAFNTRDFTLTVTAGGPGVKVATVTGNTLPVTIHRFPPTIASRVHLGITGPQTEPTTVAARIYELEGYSH